MDNCIGQFKQKIKLVLEGWTIRPAPTNQTAELPIVYQNWWPIKPLVKQTWWVGRVGNWKSVQQHGAPFVPTGARPPPWWGGGGGGGGVGLGKGPVRANKHRPWTPGGF